MRCSDPTKELHTYFVEQFARLTAGERSAAATQILAWWKDNPAPESW